jgi:hypothetical protein
MTKEQWAAVEEAVSGIFGSAKLKCDGYDVTLNRERVSKNRLGITVFVNGAWKGAWLMHDSQHEETRRFMCPVTRYVNPPKLRADLVKIYGGKRCPKAEIERINRKFTTFQPYWTNVTALRRHLVKHNQVIEIIEPKGI